MKSTDTYMVPYETCRKCRYYSNFADSWRMCMYFIYTGVLRSSLHPEGLTKECREFEPKQRTHRYQAQRR